jgi:dihydrofolate synthase/folylpolyglutamate synthase
MLNTKDIAGFLRPLGAVAERLHAVSIPGEANTIPAEETARIAGEAGLAAEVAPGVEAAITSAKEGAAERILICGSLYLAGHVLRLD